jgi:hypothetical protein
LKKEFLLHFLKAILTAVACSQAKASFSHVMSWPRQLVTCLSSWRLEFMPRSGHVVFMVDKVALGQVFLFEFFGFPLSVSFHHDFILVYNFGVNNKPLGQTHSSCHGCSEYFFRLNSASKVYQVKKIAKETNPSVNNKCQAIEIRKGNNSMLKSIKK